MTYDRPAVLPTWQDKLINEIAELIATELYEDRVITDYCKARKSIEAFIRTTLVVAVRTQVDNHLKPIEARKLCSDMLEILRRLGIIPH